MRQGVFWPQVISSRSAISLPEDGYMVKGVKRSSGLQAKAQQLRRYDRYNSSRGFGQRALEALSN